MRIQTKLEEQLNAVTHAFGALLGIAALVLLIVFDANKTAWSLFSVIVYGISIILLFTASTLFHSVKREKLKQLFRIIDHISIYFLIAGTYTPVLLITLESSMGWTLLWVVWGIAAFGVVLKLFFTGRFNIFSTLLYLLMGWLIVFDVSTFSGLLDYNAVLLLIFGGMSYTVGIIFYMVEKIPFHHVIWHLFVLAGAICHFFMIFLYII